MKGNEEGLARSLRKEKEREGKVCAAATELGEEQKKGFKVT